MKTSWARHLCLIGWLLATTVESYLLAHTPPVLEVFGHDLGGANRRIFQHDLAFIVICLLMAVAAYFFRKRGLYLVMLSCTLFLIKWFPFVAVAKYGFYRVFSTTYRIGLTTTFKLTLLNDVLLPTWALVCITLSLVELCSLSKATSLSQLPRQ